MPCREKPVYIGMGHRASCNLDDVRDSERR